MEGVHEQITCYSGYFVIWLDVLPIQCFGFVSVQVLSKRGINCDDSWAGNPTDFRAEPERRDGLSDGL
jgi:hypothetical protein